MDSKGFRAAANERLERVAGSVVPVARVKPLLSVPHFNTVLPRAIAGIKVVMITGFVKLPRAQLVLRVLAAIVVVGEKGAIAGAVC